LEELGSDRVYLINNFDILGGADLTGNEYFADGVHPNNIGY
jgi:hypothetical protein